MKNKLNDQFEVLRRIESDYTINQRILASNLGFSLGKINYCVRELKKKGYIKIKNFKNNPDKSKYLYILTPKGLGKKISLTFIFMKKKNARIR